MELNQDISSYIPKEISQEEYKNTLGLNTVQEEKITLDKTSLYSIAEFYNVEAKELRESFRKGIKIESKNISKDSARQIVLDNLSKNPKHYNSIPKPAPILKETPPQPVEEYQTQSSLNPEIWEGDKIKPELAQALIKIAKKFYKDLNIYYPLEDIILVGSSANYNWTKLSDVDLHLLIDFSQVKDPQLFKDYVDSKKNEFNSKYDLKYKEHPVEVYVQDVEEPNAAQGVYSLMKDEWIKIPKKEDIEVPDSEIDKKAEPLINQIDDLIADRATTPEDIRDLKAKIRKFRKSGLETDGEYSIENLAFKKLRYNGYLEKLSDLEKHINIKDFGLENIKETISDTLKKPLASLTKYISSNINIEPLPKVKFIDDDKENANNILGKTAYYNPNNKSITLYTLNRHPKDILRSFSHEMIHHNQNLEDRLNNINTTNTNEDGDLPEIEREAYEKGNMFFRNWEDQIKNTPLNEIIIRTPFSLFKLYDAYRKDGFYKDYITKNGYMVFHLLSNDLIDKIYPDSKDKELAQREIEKLSKENGSSYILFDSQNKIIELPIPLGQGYYAEVIDGRWIRDRRKDSSEVILDSEKNFKEIIKSDPNYVIQKPEDNIIVYKSNGQYVFFNLATETILGKFDDYDKQWDPDTGYRGNNYIIKKDGKAGFASLENGVLTTNFEFEDVKDRMGYKEGYTYYLDKNNKPLYKVKGTYDSIYPTDTDKFIVRGKKGFALVTSDGKIIIPSSQSSTLRKVNNYYIRSTSNTFAIFDENGNQLSVYDIREPQLMNIRNFTQLDKILQIIPAEDLHKIFSLLDWAQIIAYSKDPEKTVELTKAGDVIAKFDDEVIKDALKRTPGNKSKVYWIKTMVKSIE